MRQCKRVLLHHLSCRLTFHALFLFDKSRSAAGPKMAPIPAHADTNIHAKLMKWNMTMPRWASCALNKIQTPILRKNEKRTYSKSLADIPDMVFSSIFWFHINASVVKWPSAAIRICSRVHVIFSFSKFTSNQLSSYQPVIAYKMEMKTLFKWIYSENCLIDLNSGLLATHAFMVLWDIY